MNEHHSTSKEAILARIRAAVRDVPANEALATPPTGYLLTTTDDRATSIALFSERVRDYKAIVQHISEEELPAAIAAALLARGIRTVVVPAGIPVAWLPSGVAVVSDEPPLTYAQLDAAAGVVTTCALGIAQTGTIVLDGGAGQGRRALSLLPDYHLCIVRAAQIVGIVPEAITHLAASQTRPLTFISGPSATSDIELNRVEGVHGPRTLEVLVVA